jgi:integrase
MAPRPYRKTYVVPHGSGWRYKRRVPQKLQDAIGKKLWLSYLGNSAYSDAVRAAGQLARNHDDLIARLKAVSRADLRAIAAAGGLGEVAIAADDRGAPFVEALAIHTDVDPLDDEEAQALQALEIIRARKAAAAMREAAVGARTLLARVDGRTPDGVESLIPIWMKRNKPRSDARMRQHVKRFIAVVGDLPARSVTRMHVAAFRDALEADTAIGRLTVSKYLDSIHALFRAAFSANAIPNNPAAGISVSKAENANYAENGVRKKAFSAEHVRTILKAAESERADAQWMLKLLAFTGARSGELAQLRKEDVTKIEGVDVLRIHDRYGPLKNKFSVRDIPIPPACHGIIAYAASVQGLWLFESFPAWKGRSRGVTFQHRVGAWLRETVGIREKGLTLHSFRHRWKTVAIEVDMPEAVRKAIMGHSEGADEHAGYGERPSLAKRAAWIKKVDPLA